MMRARTPDALKDLDRPLEECVAACFPRSHVLLEGARHSLFYSLPVAFDPAAGEGCYLATVDRDEQGQPWRFLDMGAQIATRAFGENEPDLTQAVPDVLREGRRPLLQYPVEAIEATLSNPRALGLALRFSGRIIAYAVGSPLEDHDEEGVPDDSHSGEHQSFYLLAMAIDPQREWHAVRREQDRQSLAALRHIDEFDPGLFYSLRRPARARAATRPKPGGGARQARLPPASFPTPLPGAAGVLVSIIIIPVNPVKERSFFAQSALAKRGANG